MKKCSECRFAKFVDGNGNPNRYYCYNEDACYARSECEPYPLICRTDRYSIEMKIKTSPRWCPFRKASKGQQEQGKKYITDRGLLAYVSNGFCKDGKWMTVAHKDTFQGTHRVVSKNLPLRDTREEAQADLDTYARKRGWKEYRW